MAPLPPVWTTGSVIAEYELPLMYVTSLMDSPGAKAGAVLASTAMVNVSSANSPSRSVARTVMLTGEGVSVLGVPMSAHSFAPEPSVTPAGSVPDVTAHVTGALPPLGAMLTPPLPRGMFCGKF